MIDLLEKIFGLIFALFRGTRGKVILWSAAVVLVVSGYIASVNNITYDPKTCELSTVGKMFNILHEDTILENSRQFLSKRIISNRRSLNYINNGRSPYLTEGGGNAVYGHRKINNQKFFWRNYAKTLKQQMDEAAKCSSLLRG